MLSLSDYTVSYGQSEVIHGIDFSVGKNEIVAVVGRNGMGKTTLMKSLVGMIAHKAGQIILDGLNVSKLKSYERIGAGIAFVPQGRMIFSTMTVQENIQTGLATGRNTSIPKYLYEMFPVLEEMKARRGGNLSGGQQQQLAIARALATEPKVLILDEPTEGIQPNIIKDMGNTLKKIRDQKGISILVSEQVLSFALDIADRILVMEKGIIVKNQLRSEVNEAQIASYLSV
ncbi:MAG TPA: urea ABC transporter ATP-binding subunit UrtE [Cellvibrionaceae bacterium]|nr:urea ABC transporter ATP-binding subunit UrtE [Cellvibrionaceae bacterium]